MKKTLSLLFIIIQTVSAQKLNFDSLSNHFGREHFKTLQEYLLIPCDANFKENILKNVDWVEKQFISRNFSSKRLETSTIPVLLLEKKSSNPFAKTILYYYHSDGQPVKKSEWFQADPFIPVLKQKINDKWEEIPFERLNGKIDNEWRIFGRATSDDKGPGIMLLAALDAISSKNLSPNYNLKILVDFEEEKGSVNLPSIIDANKKDLIADLLLIFDGPGHESNLPTITYGARGIATLTLTTYGPILPLHSGHFGNYAPNPALKISKLLAGMKSEDGKVKIPGFYDGVVLDAKTKAKLKDVPDDLTRLNTRLAIKKADNVGKNLQEALMFPSLNIRGLKSGEIGDLATTIIPDKAIAEIDIRTVKSTNPEKLILNVKNYIEKQGYYIVEKDPTLEERAKYENICKINSRPSYGAFSTDMNGVYGQWIEKAISKTTNLSLVRLPTMGGSVPISPFVSKLGINAVIIPTVNADNNQHAANENLRIGNYFEGIKTMMGLLTEEF